MGRRSTKGFVKELADALEREPQTKQELVDGTGCDPTSIQEWLETLCDIGYAIETKDGYRRRYRYSDRQVGLQARNILAKLEEERLVPAYVETEKLLAMIEDRPDILHKTQNGDNNGS